MKKFFIPLILLCGFFVLIPQSILADVIIPVSNKEKQETEKQYKQDLICVNKIKAKLPQKYIGPNLKAKKQSETPYIFYTLYKQPWENINLSTENEYMIDSYSNALDVFDRFPFQHEEPVIGITRQLSVVYDCREYIMLYNYTQVENGPGGVVIIMYDVTDVPPGSYLKYITDKKEFKVLAPTQESYQEIIESQKKELKNRNERLKVEQKRKIEQQKLIKKEKVKDKISIIVFVIGIIILVIILIKSDFERFKK